MRLHMLQQVVVELELDPAGATRVGLCGEKESGRLKGRTNPNACWVAEGRLGAGHPGTQGVVPSGLPLTS